MSVALVELVAFLDAELDAASFRDYGPNGLQVDGEAGELTCVATAVSATLETIERAAELGAQLLVCHHGLLWDHEPHTIDAVRRRRLQALFGARMALCAYHLPLDAHPVHGNNAGLAQALGLRVEGRFVEVRGARIGLYGALDAPLSLAELGARLAAACGGREPQLFMGGPAAIQRLGICSGGSGGALAEAAALGLDAFISGEPEEWSRATAHEYGISFLAAGHHASEVFGVRALAELVQSRFGLEAHFLDAVNPV